MNAYVVFDITGRTHYPPRALEALNGLPLRLESRPLKSTTEVVAQCQEADILLLTALRMTREVMESLPRLKGMVRYGVGVDNIDVEAAQALGIEVANVRGYCTEEVADQALALLLACARNLIPHALSVRQGKWHLRRQPPLHRLRGQILGIIGLGRIGRALAARAQSLGLRILAFDPYLTEEEMAQAGAHKVELRTLLAEADYVSIHCPLTDETRHLIGARELAQMKPTAYLINTARGGVVDQIALVEALREGRLAGAGLDVLEAEPPDPHDPLLQLENVILSPHMAWYSEEAAQDVVVGAFAEVARMVRGWVTTEERPS